METLRRNLAVSLDAGLIALSTILAIIGRNSLPWFSSADVAPAVKPLWFVITIVWMGLLAALGAYKDKNQGTGTREYQTVANASALTAGLVGVCLYLTHYELPRGFFGLLFVGGTSVLLTGRYCLRQVTHALRRRGRLMVPVLVAGDPEHVDQVAEVLRRESWMGLRVDGSLLDAAVEATPGGIPRVGSLSQVEKAAERQGVDVVVFASGALKDSADFRRTAWELEERQVRMIVVPDITDVSAERVQLRPVAGIPLVHVEPPTAVQAARFAKRAFDVVGATFLMLFSLPVVAATALAIKLDDGGPVFFRQQRVGLREETFSCFKFRSMCVDAEQVQQRLMSDKTDDDIMFKMHRDPRITRVGRFIRRMSIDEIPQFLNVLRGDMSLVGPRPALPQEVALYTPTALRRLHVRPGLTGLWQVSGRADLSWEDTLRYDLFYVDNWSMMQDLLILVRTAQAVVRGSGAY